MCLTIDTYKHKNGSPLTATTKIRVFKLVVRDDVSGNFVSPYQGTSIKRYGKTIPDAFDIKPDNNGCIRKGIHCFISLEIAREEALELSLIQGQALYIIPMWIPEGKRY